MSVLVIHPGRQHSHQLARALYEHNLLAGYWTGVPAADPSTKGPLYRWLSSLSPQETADLPGALVRQNYVAPIARRFSGRLCSPGWQKAFQHRVLKAFDRWSARQLPDSISAVICYENSARETFRVAKRMGTTTILDAASFHYAWQDAFYEPVEADEVHRQINSYKEEEIRLADHILTVSELARESYVDAGVPEDKVTSVPMGANLSDLASPDVSRAPADRPFTFLFVGHAGRRKGTDTLLSASKVLHESGVVHRVWFAGDADDELFIDTPSSVERLGYLGRGALVKTMQRADVLVLPSRHDSFGRVVIEAMATGLPVLVSENVGAKEAINEGENGWVIPAGDVEALARHMQWCEENREKVRLMKTAAVDTAQEYTWCAYRERVRGVVQDVVEAQ